MDKDTKKEIVKRLKISAGHINKVGEMVESDRYCIDVLQQTEAVKGALKKTEEIILDSHLRTCVVDSFKGGQENKSIKEVLEVFRKR